MSKGYPSRRRARKAFERGVRVGFARGVNRNPYRNGKLAELWERGRQMGLQGRRPKPRREVKAKAPAAAPARPVRRGGWNGGRR